MMLRKLHMSVTTLSALSLMAAGVLTVSASVPAMAAQQVNTPVTLEHVTTENAITLTGENGAPELVCMAKTPQDSYEVGYKFTMDLSDLKAKWNDAVATWRTMQGLRVDDLDALGEFTVKVTFPADVEVEDASYTTEAYAPVFEAANANSSLLKLAKVHDVQVIDNALSVHLVVDRKPVSEVNAAFAGGNAIVLPTLDNTLYVSAENVEKHAGAKTGIEVSTAEVTGLLDVPETRSLFSHLAEKAPLNVSGSAKGAVTLGAKTKPYMEIVHKAKDASSPALPAGITALNKTAERPDGEDPDALPEAPEAGKLKLETEEGTWTFENYTSENSGVCGKRMFTGLWAWTPKVEDKEPGTDAPQSKPGADAPQSKPGADAPQSKPGAPSEPGTDAPQSKPGADAPQSKPGTDAPQSKPGTDAPGKKPEGTPGTEGSGYKPELHPDAKVPGDNPHSTPKGDSSKPKDVLKQTVAPSVSSVMVGKEIVFNAAGFLPGTDVTFKVYSTEVVVGTVKADKDGKASIKWTVPADFATGKHKVVAMNDKAQRAESSFIVKAPAQEQTAAQKSKSTLAATGTSAEALIVLSMMGTLAGAAAYAQAARRRS